ncbi:DinB family protein [Aquimarina sp. 2201CG14-23]|uniref:DinB family protein n=1 Tax=Aquimarina mycalae TaxID=3040073 RepID=UPI002477F79E|nr:DinB family protein [Aquimarina sp. 2201CG14-23]MDH7444352.1 DinB family protein [Aquimarina sp. 2201CG14-23]
MKFELNDAISILEKTPILLKGFLQGLPSEWIYENEGDNTWSSFDVIGHLIHGEKTDWMIRTEIILSTAPDKTFEPFDRFAQFENSSGKTISELLAEFETLRNNNIITLKSKNLSLEDLNRKGMHPELGEVSLSQLLAAWTVHDLGHIAQISRVIAKQYKNEVGPWPKYLTILNYAPKE